ncbi:MAG: hypothetical protein ABIJ34_01465 [archaeon]
MESNVNLLAETLARSGLAMSPNEAQRMARSIIGTESMVQKDFNESVSRIESSYPSRSKMTYQEEIDSLIEKTNFEHKEFHVPIAGYNRERVKKDAGPVFYELEEPKEAKSDGPFSSYENPGREDPKPASVAAAPAERVYSEVLDDNRPLVQVLQDKPVEAAMPSDEFIVDIKEPEEVNEPVTRELFEKPRVRIPVPKVDLMDHFKFG